MTTTPKSEDLKGFEKNRLRAGSITFESKEDKKNYILKLIESQPRTPADLRSKTGDSAENIRRYCKALEAERKIERQGAYWIKKNADPALIRSTELEQLDEKAFYQSPRVQPLLENAKREDLISSGAKSELKLFERICLGKYLKSFKVHPDNWTHPETTKDFIAKWKQEKGKKRLVSNVRRVLRLWLGLGMKLKLSEAELLALGIDGKKDNAGKYANVKLTDEQIIDLIEYYEDRGDLEMAAYVAFAIETFGRPNRIFEAKKSDFEFIEREIERAVWSYNPDKPIYNLERIEELRQQMQFIPEMKKHLKIEKVKVIHIFGTLHETKTGDTWPKRIEGNKAVSVLTKWWQARKGTDRVFGNIGETWTKWNKRINISLEEAFAALKFEHPYFYMRPSYALRHVGAHVWLRRTGYDYPAVAAMGWKDLSTLKEFYGKYDLSQLDQKTTGVFA